MDVPMDYHVWGTMLDHYQTHAKAGQRNSKIKDSFVTFNMPYQFALAISNISCLQARREGLSKKFFSKITNNLDNSYTIGFQLLSLFCGFTVSNVFFVTEYVVVYLICFYSL